MSINVQCSHCGKDTEFPETGLQNSLELLLKRTEDVRNAQNKYFGHRSDTNLRESKKCEKALDDLLVNLKRRGYNGDRFVDNVSKKLF